MKKKVKNRKKLMSMLLTVSMVTMIFAGCSSSTSDSSTSTSGKSVDKSAEESQSTSESAANSTSEDAFEESLKGKGDGLVVGLAMGDLSSTYIVAASQYFKKIMGAAGAEVKVVNCDNDASLQADQIDDFVNMGVDIIAVHANDPAAVAPAVKAATDAGIPVVGFNKTVDGGNLNFSVYSSDNVATGASAAQWLADKAKELKVDNPKIAVMQGTMTASDAYERQDGIEEVAEKEGLVLLNEPCDWLGDNVESALNDVLTANPDLFGVITHSDCMDSGVISALTQNGLAVDSSDKSHIYYAGIDCDPTGIEALESGVMDVCIEQSPLALATVIAKGCLEVVAQGKTLNGEITKMNTTVITADMTKEPERWAIYDPEKAMELWPGTESAWNNYLTDY